MNDVKSLVAKNITALRQSAGMTQADLASALNYSDKAVSKWERGESVPDVSVLCEIARLFGVTVDYLVSDHAADDGDRAVRTGIKTGEKSAKNRAFVTAMSVILVWLVAAIVYLILDAALPSGATAHRLAFVFAVPASLVVWLVFNSVWFDRRRNYLIISLLVWSLLAAAVVTLLTFGVNMWKLLLLGVPGQIIILLWSKLSFK